MYCNQNVVSDMVIKLKATVLIELLYYVVLATSHTKEACHNPNIQFGLKNWLAKNHVRDVLKFINSKLTQNFL